MKKIYVILAIAALTLCVASCGNKKKAQEAEPACTECTKAEGECCKDAKDEVKAAAEAAAVDVAKTGIEAAADAAKDAIKK